MDISARDVQQWCEQLLAPRALDDTAWDADIRALPTLEDLADLPERTRVLVRCDTNVTVTSQGDVLNDARLISLRETILGGRERGWIQVIHGHAGDGQESLHPVARHLERVLGCPVMFFPRWMDDASGQILSDVGRALDGCPAGTVAMLENARRHPLETSLWRPRPDNLPLLIPRLVNYLRTLTEHVAHVHVNEGFAASNPDLSSAFVPLGMERVAVGRHVQRELAGPVRAAREAEAIMFSGAKFNKLDDLEQILERGTVRLVLAAGLLAVPLMWAQHAAAGQPFELGRPEEVPQSRCHQALRLLDTMRRKRVELFLPFDFVLQNGVQSSTMLPGLAQRDVGPRTLDALLDRLHRLAAERPGAVFFHNGVLGQFEQPEFAAGTRRYMTQLPLLERRGLRVMVGGGEGGTAFSRYGDPASITHSFTAGTTILKALGARPIPYVWSLGQAAARTEAARGRAF